MNESAIFHFRTKSHSWQPFHPFITIFMMKDVKSNFRKQLVEQWHKQQLTFVFVIVAESACFFQNESETQFFHLFNWHYLPHNSNISIKNNLNFRLWWIFVALCILVVFLWSSLLFLLGKLHNFIILREWEFKSYLQFLGGNQQGYFVCWVNFFEYAS